MFNSWRTLRTMRHKIELIDREVSDNWPTIKDKLGELLAERSIYAWLLDSIASEKLMNRADLLSVDVQRDQNPSWWQHRDGFSVPILSESGRIRVRKLIQEAKFENKKKWVELLAPIITALTGLVGATIGLLAFLWSISK